MLENKVVELRGLIPDEICGIRGATQGNTQMFVLDNWIDSLVFNETSITG